MGKKLAITILAVFYVAAVFGCNHYSSYKQQSQMDANWGRSYETAKYNQTLNPDAVSSSEPMVGLDGNVADRVMKDYRTGKAPETATQLSGFQVGDK